MSGNRQTSRAPSGRQPALAVRQTTRAVSPTPHPLLALILLAALALLAAGTPARATLLEPLTLHDLAGRADLVLHGRVESVHTITVGPERMPVTVAQIAVLEVIAGDLPPRRRVTVTQPGGTAGGVALDYAGRPRFTPGREVILFLIRRAAGRFIIVGLAQGKFDIAGDDGHGRRRLSRDLHGAAFALPATETPPGDLSDLRRRLQSLPRDLSGAQP